MVMVRKKGLSNNVPHTVKRTEDGCELWIAFSCEDRMVETPTDLCSVQTVYKGKESETIRATRKNLHLVKSKLMKLQQLIATLDFSESTFLVML